MNSIKTISVVLLLLAGYRQVFSQTEKGNLLVGGSTSLTHTDNGVSHTSSFSFSPNVSYLLARNFAAGVMLNIDGSSSKSDVSDFKSETNALSAGPTIRYYFPVADKFYVFPELDLLFGNSNSKVTLAPGVEGTSKFSQTIFRAGAGGSYFIAKNVGFEGYLYYQNSSTKADPGSSGSSGSINFRIGLQIYILRNSN